MPQYDESFLIDCAIGEKKKLRSYSITSAAAAAVAAVDVVENCKINKKPKRWHSFRKRAPEQQTPAVYRSLYSLIDRIDNDTEFVCKLLFRENDSEKERKRTTKNRKKKKLQNEAICNNFYSRLMAYSGW